MRYFLLIKVNSLKSSVGKSALVLLFGLAETRYSLCGCRRSSPSIWRQNRRGARRAERQKIQKPQNTFFGLNPLFAQKLGLESIRGENLEFFQLKTPQKPVLTIFLYLIFNLRPLGAKSGNPYFLRCPILSAKLS